MRNKYTNLMILAGVASILFYFLPLMASDLPERYRKWLEEEVAYIITAREREVFLKLQTDQEREVFIEAFWKQRDPSPGTPGTPGNEFREEHYRRLKYANQYFGRGTGQPGWKTDQGRIYIILGPPNNIETYENIMGVYPAQVWFYYGDPNQGLPPGFNLIFFKKEGTGEYILYSPSDHGPQALVADYMYDARDAREAYQRLYQLSPQLAQQSLSLIPGEKVEPGAINLVSSRLLATIMSLPQKKVEDAYAEAWFRHKDVIEVEYSTNYIQTIDDLWAVRSPDGHYLIHYAVEPAKLSVVQDSKQYLVRFDLNGRVSDDRGQTVFQFEKSLSLNLSQEELAEIGKRAVSLQDVFPLIPGSYTFDLLIKNPLSREFSSVTRKLYLPAEIPSPEISQILLAYGTLDNKEGKRIAPYQIGTTQLLTRCQKSYSNSDSLVACLQIAGLSQEAKNKTVLKIGLVATDSQLVYSREISPEDTIADFFYLVTIPLSSFKPGYYTLTADLIIDGQLQDSRQAELEISLLSSLPTPILISKVNLTESEQLLLTGIQYLNTGDLQKALQLLTRAHDLQPGERSALAYAQALFRSGEFKRVVELLKPYDRPEAPAELLSLLGRSFHSLNQSEEAINYYEKYLNRFGANLEILNYLGSCYYQLGDKEKALNLWERSLDLEPNQKKLKELVDSLKKK